MRDRDPSHGMPHFHRVWSAAHALVSKERCLKLEPSELELLKIELASLAHDVCDHKYCEPKDVERTMGEMRAVLRDACGLNDAEVEAVLLAAENVSLSREKKNLLQGAELDRVGARWLRNVVSDADKLDALGAKGLERIVQCGPDDFRGLGDEAWYEQLKTLSKEVAEPRQGYLIFEASRALATKLIEEMHEALTDVAFLRDLKAKTTDPSP